MKISFSLPIPYKSLTFKIASVFQMCQLILIKKKRELSEYKAIYIIKDYFLLIVVSPHRYQANKTKYPLK
ncbi:hypothetical protein CN571_27990 [Bacillus pseudomycoides]|uniref:Uncharacterized protein n=1 Tax=Bacillus cereus TaxID=1396 RepID=A0A2C1CRM0_BACCE|nr:hypothetical protein CON70_23830 [Bacillus pseudomycoides]PGS90253.1 hypothetical protein COD09_29165 [Bacillus cereus]PEO79641.1 hypothetical protein CN571_27990 [Bacillus pseudomycoides]PFW89037.1 hypothetical protein COL29_26265 [Bacillus pseudomycoides]PFX41278.1 hypothetical protein COL32_18690 [Bacillus pseudomycoides]